MFKIDPSTTFASAILICYFLCIRPRILRLYERNELLLDDQKAELWWMDQQIDNHTHKGKSVNQNA